jgi:hypothetical protein
MLRRASSGGPSTTTTVILRNLSPSTTETSLKGAIGEIAHRKVEMEPGCAIHLQNEGEATYLSSLITSKFGYEGSISSTTMPSLLLQNLPNNVCIQKLEKSFAKFKPKIVRVTGSSSLQVGVRVIV